MAMTRNGFAVSVCLWLAIGTAEAEFIGLNITPNQWAPAANSAFHFSDTDSIGLADDLDMENPEQTSMTIILEHPIALLPNLRYQSYELNYPETSTLNSDFDSTAASFDLSQDDIVLYYQLLDNRINLDLGVDLKRFNGEVSFAGATDTRISVDETIPLFYLSARYDLPYTGFYVGADINTSIIDLGFSESNAQDSTIMLGYDSGNGVGFEGGFKYFSLDLDQVDDPDANLEYDGVYLNGYFNF